VDHLAAKIDDERTRRGEARDRQLDPHGVAPAGQANQDEPRAWPSSDRQKLEATANRVEQGKPEHPLGEQDPRRPPGTGRDAQPRPAVEGQIELPVPGYPNSEEALTSWFNSTYSRTPSAREIGVLMNAMAQRDSTPPHVGPEPDPHGWETKPSAPPARRR
jgi:hypothetical protein